MIPLTNSLESVLSTGQKVSKELKKMGLKEPEIIDYGHANGWIETPVLVKECCHAKKVEKISNCNYRYTCEVCGFTYNVDSGG